MLKNRLSSEAVVVGLMLLLLMVAGSSVLLADDNNKDNKVNTPAPTPIGAWFGIARPCVAPANGIPATGFDAKGAPIPVTDPAPDPSICAIAGATAPNAFPVVQVTMIPTLLADGTVLADDFAELLDHHTTAQGKWEAQGKVKVDGKWLDKYQATFIWFMANPGGDTANPKFFGSIRPRFVTFFDKDHPDEMRGYIQPYLYPYTKSSADGTGQVNFDSTGKFPVPNPSDPLPEGCDPTTPALVSCLGTLHFYIHRIPSR
jgi:hypothetical protein